MRYTEGIMSDGPVILMDGQPMTPSEIVSRLNHDEFCIRQLMEAIDISVIEYDREMLSAVSYITKMYLNQSILAFETRE